MLITKDKKLILTSKGKNRSELVRVDDGSILMVDTIDLPTFGLIDAGADVDIVNLPFRSRSDSFVRDHQLKRVEILTALREKKTTKKKTTKKSSSSSKRRSKADAERQRLIEEKLKMVPEHLRSEMRKQLESM